RDHAGCRAQDDLARYDATAGGSPRKGRWRTRHRARNVSRDGTRSLDGRKARSGHAQPSARRRARRGGDREPTLGEARSAEPRTKKRDEACRANAERDAPDADGGAVEIDVFRPPCPSGRRCDLVATSEPMTETRPEGIPTRQTR